MQEKKYEITLFAGNEGDELGEHYVTYTIQAVGLLQAVARLGEKACIHGENAEFIKAELVG